MTTALAVAGILGAFFSWYHASQARKAAAQVQAGKQAVASVDSDLKDVPSCCGRIPRSMTAVEAAEAEAAAGAMELGGNNTGPFVVKYLNANHPERLSHDGEAWCVAFFLYCWLQVGPLPFAFTRSAHELWERMPSSQRLHPADGFLLALPTAEPGDALFWNFHTDGTDAPTHVNMLHHIDRATGTVYTIGGNEGNEESGAPVKVKARIDLHRLWGIGSMRTVDTSKALQSEPLP